MHSRPSTSSPRVRVVGSALVLAALVLAGCHDYDFSPRYGPGEIGIYDDLFAVSAPDPQHAMAVGYYGAVYRTTDQGESWEKLDSGTQTSLYDVSMATPDLGWVVGQRGMIMRTTDGGSTWGQQPNIKREQGSHLFAVHAIDGNTALAVGEWGTIIFTDDGGNTWQDDRSLTIDETHPRFVWLAPVEQERVRAGEKVYEDVGLNDVYCLPAAPTNCWAVGEFGYIFYSQDTGLSWERAEIIGDISIDPIEMAYNTMELVDPDVDRLALFAGEVADESHLNIDIEAYATERELREFGEEEDPYELFEILEARNASVRQVLEDNGILFDRIRVRGGPPWDYEDFLDEDPGFLKRYLESRLAPASGVEVRVAQNPYLFRIRFKDANNGLIAGVGGVVLRSTDGGRTWRYVKTDRKQALFAVDSVNGRSIAVGEKGLVRVSLDGGETWRRPERGFPTVFTFMRDIDFSPDHAAGYIVGQRGKILRSTDEGASWSRVLPPEDRRYAQ